MLCLCHMALASTADVLEMRQQSCHIYTASAAAATHWLWGRSAAAGHCHEAEMRCPTLRSLHLNQPGVTGSLFSGSTSILHAGLLHELLPYQRWQLPPAHIL